MVEQIRHVDARVRVRGAKVDAPNTPLEAVDLTLDLRDGVLKMAPLALGIAPGQGGPPRWHVLGPDVLAGETPQAVVPAGDWQAARADAGWAFVSCVVAPRLWHIWSASSVCTPVKPRLTACSLCSPANARALAPMRRCCW
jgi:hypothetical protein